MAFTDRSEGQMTALVEQVAGSVVEDWDSLDKFNQHQIKDTILPLLAACIDAVDAEPYIPKRGDEIEAWVKNERDQYDEHTGPWGSLDGLLDDYRFRANTGTPLTEQARAD